MRIEDVLKLEDEKVSARELYEYLGVKSRFNDWIGNRIKKYKFEEENDYIAITKSLVTAQGNSSEYLDYLLSLDMAKELSMVENNDNGRKARKYFIYCEKQLIDLKIKNEQLQKEIKEKELSQVKAASMLLQHKDKLGLTKGYLYPILRELGVTDKNKFKAHSLIKQLLIGKYENVKKDKEFNTAQFIKDYRALAEQLQEENHSCFPDKNQTSFWDSII